MPQQETEQSPEWQVAQNQNFKFNPETMREPDVFIMNSNITKGYDENYNDKTDYDQRMQFAMEVEQTMEREMKRRRALQRAHGGGLDGPPLDIKQVSPGVLGSGLFGVGK